jgi:hypothetical protein
MGRTVVSSLSREVAKTRLAKQTSKISAAKSRRWFTLKVCRFGSNSISRREKTLAWSQTLPSSKWPLTLKFRQLRKNLMKYIFLNTLRTVKS